MLEPKPPTPALRVRSAGTADVEAICRLIAAWADQGLTLPRGPEEVSRCIGEFVVVERLAAGRAGEGAHERGVEPGGKILAAGALEVHSPRIAEIRSVSVDPEAKGCGAGREVVRFLLETAAALDVEEVALLTKIPAFFAKFGFREVRAEDLPAGFVEEAIAARGRTLVGRSVMARYVNGGGV
jgi:N-acetylglutamate synthase-like GNAT family acetyltransferase